MFETISRLLGETVGGILARLVIAGLIYVFYRIIKYFFYFLKKKEGVRAVKTDLGMECFKLVAAMSLIIIGCSLDSDKKESMVSNERVLIDTSAKNMNRFIDSGVVLYKKAIRDRRRGMSKSDIFAKYEGKAQYFERKTIEAFDNFKHKASDINLPEKKFKEFKERVKVDELQAKMDTLEKLGVDFNLSE
jgi:hypothetical protein